VVHRDLALRNLLVTGGGDKSKWIVKVSDLVSSQFFAKSERYRDFPALWNLLITNLKENKFQ
jgi:hypothetical protein